MKQFVFLLLVLFVSCLIATPVQPAGSGTQSDPYQIARLDNLCWMASDAGDRNADYAHFAIVCSLPDVNKYLDTGWGLKNFYAR